MSEWNLSEEEVAQAVREYKYVRCPNCNEERYREHQGKEHACFNPNCRCLAFVEEGGRKAP